MSAHAALEPARPLRTGSLRRRLTLAVLAVLAGTLVLLGVGVDRAYSQQAEAGVQTLLTSRLQLARQAARSGVGPQQLVNRVQVEGVRAQLTLTSGAVLGDVVPVDQRLAGRSTTLAAPGRVDGARLLLTADDALVAGPQARLRRVLLAVGLAALLLGGVAVAVTVPLVLRPLAAMARLADQIAGGRRGGRLSPTRRDTDVGRTAAALDAMLDELEGAESRARAAEARSRTFLADAAHELRTPLTGVRAGAETLLQHGDALPADDRQRLQSLVVAEAERAGRLVDDLLAAARLDAGLELTPVPVELRALAAAEAERARLRVPSVRLLVEGAEVVLDADREKVAAVLRNLVDNAVRAAGPAGTVRLAVGVEEGAAVVEVSDDGPGVPAADSERIFERLVRLDSSRSADAGGSGLGLAIARGYARAHGGELVHLPGRVPGATFRLTLPLRTPPSPEVLPT